MITCGQGYYAVELYNSFLKKINNNKKSLKMAAKKIKAIS